MMKFKNDIKIQYEKLNSKEFVIVNKLSPIISINKSHKFYALPEYQRDLKIIQELISIVNSRVTTGTNSLFFKRLVNLISDEIIEFGVKSTERKKRDSYKKKENYYKNNIEIKSRIHARSPPEYHYRCPYCDIEGDTVDEFNEHGKKYSLVKNFILKTDNQFFVDGVKLGLDEFDDSTYTDWYDVLYRLFGDRIPYVKNYKLNVPTNLRINDLLDIKSKFVQNKINDILTKHDIQPSQLKKILKLLGIYTDITYLLISEKNRNLINSGKFTMRELEKKGVTSKEILSEVSQKIKDSRSPVETNVFVSDCWNNWNQVQRKQHLKECFNLAEYEDLKKVLKDNGLDADSLSFAEYNGLPSNIKRIVNEYIHKL